MLKVIREHSHSFLIRSILWMVVISFILTIFLVWGRGSQGLSGSSTAVSTVGGVEISAESFLRLYKANLNRLQQSISGNIDQQWLQQLAASQSLNDLINEEVIVQEAISRGIVVSPEEIRNHIMERYEIFQQNGRFIGQEKYLEILRASRISPSEFEEAIRRDVYLQKFNLLIIDGITLSEAELKEEFKRQREEVSINYLLFQPAAFTDLIVPSDKELAEYYKGNKENYREPERRRITYIYIEPIKLVREIEVSEREVQRYYQTHLEDFKIPVQRRARHILFKVSPNATTETEEETRKKAEEVLSRARAGEDFAELAKEYSEDDTTAQSGGDLGYSSRGRMVKEIDDVLFSMEINDISDVIRTRFGYHIVQLTDIQRAYYQPLSDAEVRDRVEKTLRAEKAEQKAEELAEMVYKEASSGNDIKAAGKQYALEVKDSGFFGKEERIEGLGKPTLLIDSVFSLKVGEISQPVRDSRSYYVFQLVEKKDSYIPPLEKVKVQVISDFKEKGGKELAKRKGEEVRKLLGENPDLLAVASQQKTEPKSPKPFKRGEQIEGLGLVPEVEKRAFAIGVGEVSEVVTIDQGFVVFQIVAKDEPTTEEFTQEKETLRETLLQQKQLRRYSAILTRLRERKKIIYNQPLINQLMS